MGVYIRDLLLGQVMLLSLIFKFKSFILFVFVYQFLFCMQYYFDTLFPRIPVPVLRTITANLEAMKLPTKHCGVTGESTRGTGETARRPPSVKASLSVSFGQRAPHRSSTRDSSPVRRTVPPSFDRDDSRRSPNCPPSRSRDSSSRDNSERDRGRERDRERNRDNRDRDRDRDRRYDHDRSRDSYERDYDRRGHEKRGVSRRSRSRSPSWARTDLNRHNSPSKDESKDKKSASSNLAKLKDLYGVLSNQKEGVGEDKGPSRSGGTEEVFRLGGSSWR